MDLELHLYHLFGTDQCHMIIHHPDPNSLVLFMIHRVLEGEMSSLAQTDSDRGLGRKLQNLGQQFCVVFITNSLYTIWL